MDYLIVLAALALAIVAILYLSKTRYTNLPRGPWGVPVFGYLPFMKPRSQALMRLKQQWGDVVLLYFGTRRVVLLNTVEAIKEAFVTKGDNFAGRMQSAFRNKMSRESGILLVDGPLWQEHRRFSLRVLRDFGLGRNVSEQVIHYEITHLYEYIDGKARIPIFSNDILMRAISNVICTITMGERPGFEDPEFSVVIDGIKQNMQQPLSASLLVFLPGADYLGFFLRLLPASIKFIKNLDRAHAYIKQKIDKHRQDLNPNEEPRDLTDAYLLQQLQLEASGEKHTFTDWQLIRVIFELFIAGTDTTSNSLSWFLIYMSLHPDIQRKVQQEIDNKIGQNRLPTMTDRKALPYTQAVLDEVQRYVTIVPSTTHRNFKTDTVQGYTVPANTIVTANIYGTHHDPKVWEKPDDFYPEHFLNDAGEYTPRPDHLIPFAIGRRSCIGESLAKMELFLFAVALIQHYEVKLIATDDEAQRKTLLGTDGVVRSPGPHGIIFTRRD